MSSKVCFVWCKVCLGELGWLHVGNVCVTLYSLSRLNVDAWCQFTKFANKFPAKKFVLTLLHVLDLSGLKLTCDRCCATLKGQCDGTVNCKTVVSYKILSLVISREKQPIKSFIKVWKSLAVYHWLVFTWVRFRIFVWLTTDVQNPVLFTWEAI